MLDTHGCFVDRHTHWEGRTGAVRVRFDIRAGGVVAIGMAGAEGDDFHPLLTVGARLRLVCRQTPGAADFDRPVLIRQEHDFRPKFSFLEEGPVRIGLRVAFDLLDDEGHYHGGGRQDIWAYPDGDIHVSTVLETEDLCGHGRVRDCYLEIAGADDYVAAQAGDCRLRAGDPEAVLPFATALPGQAVLLLPADAPPSRVPAAAVYWARTAGSAFPFGSDHGLRPPFYASRWPTGMEQWTHNTQRAGWALAPGAAAVLAPPRLRLAWLREADVEGNVVHGGTAVMSLAGSVGELQQRIQALQQPLEPDIVGGAFRCFTEEDGVYEVGQGNPARAAITFPPDPLARVARVRYFRRKTDPRHCGAVVARVDGTPVRAQLMSEGQLTDDICVPMEMAHRNDSVDDVIVSLALHADRPTELVIEKAPGIQAVYQSEIGGLDLHRHAGNRRDVAVWSSRNPERPACEFDLFSSALRRITALGQREPAVWEAPLAWFNDSGHARYDYCTDLDAFAIEQNGPDAVCLYARSHNPTRSVRSEAWLRVPGDSPRLRFEATLRMTVLRQWDCPTCEISDIFPFPSRLVETWFYDGVLFMEPGKSALIYSFRPELSYRDPGPGRGDRLFYGLYASDRGNVLTLFHNRSHPRHALVYGVCGNYLDIHIRFEPAAVPVAAGEVFEVSYIFELYGDRHTSVDELHWIGQRSLETGDIVIP